MFNISKIKNFLRGKYWLWGILFGLFLDLVIAIIFSAPYVFLHLYNFLFLIFSGIMFEIFFRILNWLQKINSVPFIRVIPLILLILLSFIYGVGAYFGLTISLYLLE